MCDCEDVKRLTVLLNMERLKTKIYRQIIEQKVDLKLDDKTEDIINEVIVRKCSPRKLSGKREERPYERIEEKREEKREEQPKTEKRKFKAFPKIIEEAELVYGENNEKADADIKHEVVNNFGIFDITVSNLEIKKVLKL